ncbi:hypothetical protein H9I38_06110 [Arthrobacter sp. UM1]|nr:hypothetical protein [Arthrobacter sp. UM1]
MPRPFPEDDDGARLHPAHERPGPPVQGIRASRRQAALAAVVISSPALAYL